MREEARRSRAFVKTKPPAVSSKTAGGARLTCYVRVASDRLLGEPIENIHELGEAFRFLWLTSHDPFGYASLDVILQDGQADPVQRRFRSRELLKNVYAEPRLLHHAPNAAHLSFDPVKPRDEALLLCLIQHEVPRNAPHSAFT